MFFMLKKILIRLFAYPFCLVLIYLGIEMINNYQNWNFSYISGKQFISGIGLILIVLVFLISDLLIVIRDFKKSS